MFQYLRSTMPCVATDLHSSSRKSCPIPTTSFYQQRHKLTKQSNQERHHSRFFSGTKTTLTRISSRVIYPPAAHLDRTQQQATIHRQQQQAGSRQQRHLWMNMLTRMNSPGLLSSLLTSTPSATHSAAPILKAHIRI